MSRFDRQNGFTLIEIMIVIAIIAAVIGIGAPRLFSTGSAMRATVRELAILPKEIRSFARLYGNTERLVIQMDEDEGHKYWVEASSGSALLLSEDQEKDLSRLSSAQREEEIGSIPHFEVEKKLTAKPKSLSRGLFFQSVELANRQAPITGGVAYIHFFPKGLGDEAAIHLTDRKNLNWTISIHPLTGKATVREGFIALKDLRTQ